MGIYWPCTQKDTDWDSTTTDSNMQWQMQYRAVFLYYISIQIWYISLRKITRHLIYLPCPIDMEFLEDGGMKVFPM